MRTHLLRPIYPPLAELEPDTGCACNDDLYVAPKDEVPLKTTLTAVVSSQLSEDEMDAYVLGGYAGI
jgi:hypothetical protein